MRYNIVKSKEATMSISRSSLARFVQTTQLLTGTAVLLLSLLIPLFSAGSAQALFSLNYELLGTHPQAATQPTVTGKTIGALKVFNNKLYAGYGDWGTNTGPIHLNPLDLQTRAFEGSKLSVPTEGITKFDIINSKLYAPMIDRTGCAVCSIGYAVGEPFESKTPVQGAHIFDMETLDGNDLWMVGSGQSTVAGAHAFRSTDGGATWSVAKTDTSTPRPTGFERYYWVAKMNGKIYMQANSTNAPAPVRIFDGTSWSEGTTDLITNGTRTTVFNNHLVATAPNNAGMSAYDGSTVTKVQSFYGVIADMAVEGDYLYVLRGDGTLARTQDLQGWQELGYTLANARSMTVQGGVVYYGTADSKLYRSTNALPVYAPDPTNLTVVPAPLFAKQYGGFGSSVLQPVAVATDAQGNTYVADAVLDAVQKFDAAGNLVKSFGDEPNTAGELAAPQSVAVGSDGAVYVLDTTQKVIKRYRADGTYIGSFGAHGMAEGSINYDDAYYPGITTDANGNVYVADAGNHRVQKFDSSGTYITQFGESGSGDGQFSYPTSVAIDASGNSYVVDMGNVRIEKFDQDGNYLAQFGSAGTENGQFNYIMSVATDGSNVYVADLGRANIQKFDQDGTYLASIGANGAGNGQFQSLYSVAVNSQFILAADSPGNKIEKFAIGDLSYQGRLDSTSTADAKFNNPTDMALDSQGNSFVVDSSNNRIEKFDKNGQYLWRFGQRGKANGQFISPRGIAIDMSDNLYVSDFIGSGYRVQKFSADGQFLTSFMLPAVLGPLVVDREGSIYVIDNTTTGKIKKYSATGVLLGAWGSAGNADGQLSDPRDLALDSNSNLYIIDSAQARVQQFTSSGTFIRSWGLPGVVEGRFKSPTGIALDKYNNVYVADSGNHRVQMFTAEGTFKTQWGTSGSDSGQFNYPVALAVDAQNKVSVVDQRNHRVQQFAYLTDSSLDDDKIRIQTALGTNITCANKLLEKDLSKRDKVYRYPHRFADFCVAVAPGSTQQFTVTFKSGKNLKLLTPRMFDPSTKKYKTILGTTITRDNSDGTKRKVIRYTVTDGGEWDADHTVNGVIKNTVALGMLQ